jgi:hypothetical protein
MFRLRMDPPVMRSALPCHCTNSFFLSCSLCLYLSVFGQILHDPSAHFLFIGLLSFLASFDLVAKFALNASAKVPKGLFQSGL